MKFKDIAGIDYIAELLVKNLLGIKLENHISRN